MINISMIGWISIGTLLFVIVTSIYSVRVQLSNRKRFNEGMAKLERSRISLMKSGERLKEMNDELDEKLKIGED